MNTTNAGVDLSGEGRVAVVTLRNPPRLNAMNRAMWQQLREVFEAIAASTQWRAVLVRGAGEAFCAGGDIAEYPAFRFDEPALRDFHEGLVWGGLQAMLDCDLPVVAAIDGACMGAGMEMASCCDVRLASIRARFGAPIARLGFPMAPREAALVAREAGLATARQMLLEAAQIDAEAMLQRGFLQQILPPAELLPQAQERAQRMSALSPQAARLNKQTLRALTAHPLLDRLSAQAYAYADSPEHREGIAAFLEKRPPQF